MRCVTLNERQAMYLATECEHIGQLRVADYESTIDIVKICTLLEIACTVQTL